MKHSSRLFYCAFCLNQTTVCSHCDRGHTIKRVLAETGVPKRSILVQSSMIEPFVPFILDTLQKFPTLTARRLYEMVKERGYPGGPDHFRQLISFYRPKKPGEAYLRLRTLPGEPAFKAFYGVSRVVLYDHRSSPVAEKAS